MRVSDTFPKIWTYAVSSPYVEMIDAQQNMVRVEYRPANQQLWMIITPFGGNPSEQPILDAVTAAQFTCERRINSENLLVLERATVELTVQPNPNAILAIEKGPAQPIRMVGSTMPRKLED